MVENRRDRIARLVKDGGISVDGLAEAFGVVTQELDSDKAMTETQFIQLRSDIRTLELRMKLWVGGALLVAVILDVLLIR